MKINDIMHFDIYGKSVQCRILAIRPHGTIDVERLSDGNCFRISGLPVVQRRELKFMGVENVPLSCAGVIIAADGSSKGDAQ